MRVRQFHSNVLIGNARVKAPLERSVPLCIPRGAQAPAICSAPVLVGFELYEIGRQCAPAAVSARMRAACTPSNSVRFPPLKPRPRFGFLGSVASA